MGWDSVKSSSVCRMNYKIKYATNLIQSSPSNPLLKADLIKSCCSANLFSSILNTFKNRDSVLLCMPVAVSAHLF